MLPCSLVLLLVGSVSLAMGVAAGTIPFLRRGGVGAPVIERRWEINNTYDYIIVGGGTAGLVLADRLSETKGVRVIVVEAGEDYLQDPLAAAVVGIPGLVVQGAGSDIDNPANILNVDWAFQTTPQKNANNRRVHYERGKMLGGSSGRNFMIYQRGSASSYNEWENLGNPEWGWRNLLPYFEKSVSYTPPNNSLRGLKVPTPIDPALAETFFHRRQIAINSNTTIIVPNITLAPVATVTATSTASPTPTFATFGTGPISLSLPPFAQAFSPFMLGALKEALGINETDSFNAGVVLGVQFVATTIQQAFRQVARSTSRTGYLRQAEASGRENGTGADAGELVVLSQALVKRIIFEKGTTKAIGVTFIPFPFDNTTTTLPPTSFPQAPASETPLYATREVIVCAGSFQSPQLLMVSGVGPRQELERQGIDVLVDLPGVGQGMEDHVFFGPTYPVSVETLSELSDNATFQALQLQNFSVNGLGPLTNPASDLIAFERLSSDLLQTIGAGSINKHIPDDFPHLEYIVSPGFPGNFSVLTFNPSTPEFPIGQNYATILAAVVAPQSRGSVTLSSSDMLDPPIIDPNWMSSPIDQAIAIAGFRRVRQTFATSFMGQILQGEEIFPGPGVTTTSEILQFIKANLMTVWHASCTCSMKPIKLGGVLDSRLRVYGTQNLRVIDTSSFPLLPPGHPQSTVYALAEKGADLIKKDHQKKDKYS